MIPELTYSAIKRCVCGHGLAFITKLKSNEKFWACGAVLMGKQILGIRHTMRIDPAKVFIMTETTTASTRPPKPIDIYHEEA